MSAGVPAVLVRPGGPRPALFGARAGRLHAVLLERALAWARSVAGERVEVSDDPIAQVAPALLERHGGPLLIAGVDAPRLGPIHAAGALADLGGGASATFGPGMDGGWYLAAIARWLPEVFEDEWEGDQFMPRALAIAQQLEIEVGVLRMERMLLTEQDVSALRVDPLTPRCVRELLEVG